MFYGYKNQYQNQNGVLPSYLSRGCLFPTFKTCSTWPCVLVGMDGLFVILKPLFFTEATLPAYCEFRSKCSDEFYSFSATSADFYSRLDTPARFESYPFLCIHLVRRAFLSKSLFSRTAILNYRLHGHCNFNFSSFKVNPYLSAIST